MIVPLLESLSVKRVSHDPRHRPRPGENKNLSLAFDVETNPGVGKEASQVALTWIFKTWRFFKSQVMVLPPVVHVLFGFVHEVSSGYKGAQDLGPMAIHITSWIRSYGATKSFGMSWNHMIHVILVGTMTKPQVQLPKGAGPEPWCWAGDGRSMDIATYEYVSMLRRSEQPTVQFVFFGVCRLIYKIGHVVCSIIFDVDRPPGTSLLTFPSCQPWKCQICTSAHIRRAFFAIHRCGVWGLRGSTWIQHHNEAAYRL